MRKLKPKSIINTVGALAFALISYYMGKNYANFEQNELEAIGQFQGLFLILFVIYNCTTKISIFAWYCVAILVNFELVQDVYEHNYQPTNQDIIAPLLTIAIGIYSYFKWRTTKPNS